MFLLQLTKERHDRIESVNIVSQSQVDYDTVTDNVLLQSLKADDFQYATGAGYCISHVLMTKARKYFEYVGVSNVCCISVIFFSLIIKHGST